MQEAAGALLTESSSPHALAEPLQSAEYSGTSSGKLKKRERPDQNAIASKKGQLNEYASPQKRECTEKVSEKDGGMVTAHGIDQLITQMRQEQASSQRIRLVGIMGMTTKEDCLRKFVQMGGVTILDEWIQDGLKSRTSDASSKEDEKGSDEEMLMILLALEKLPIDLEALKGCSIGKSVKRLRSAKNGELQRKARKLVDTWRKRVDFEISSTICAGAHDHSSHLDSTSRSSDLSPARAMESTDIPNAPTEAVLMQEINGTLVSTLSNASTSDASPHAQPDKSSISSEKDAGRKTGRLSSMSASTMSPAKRHKQLTAFSTDKESKEEMVHATDSQKLKERDHKGENSGVKIEPNGNVGSSDARKTNEYRKKLRSGGSSAAPPSSNELVAPAAQARDNADDKKACIDSNTGDSEQVPKRNLASKSMTIVDSNEAPDPPGLRGNITACKERIPTETCPQGGKTEHMNESCLSSQSSCTDKRTEPSLIVTFDTTKKMSSHSLPQGDAGGGVQKCSASAPDMKPSTTSTAVALPKRSETVETRQGGAVEGEESCCSYDNAVENLKRASAECPSSDAAKDAACLPVDGVSESSKGITKPEKPEKEQKMEVATKKASETPTAAHLCHEFDLNEGLAMEEFMQDSQPSGVPHAYAGSLKATSTLSAPVAISAASKGAYIPPLSLMNRCDIGWKGSAATSAFRPAEPRHLQAAKSQCALPPPNEGRNVNSFDLNVADHGSLEDCPPASSGRLRNHEACPDLNADGGNVEMQVSASASEIGAGWSAEKRPDKRPMLDFDLNEQLDEVLPPEQEMVSISAARRFDAILPFGGPSGHATPGDVVPWHAARSTPFPFGSANVHATPGDVAASWHVAGSALFPFGSANVPPRTDQLYTGSVNQPISSRQASSSAGGPPPSYSHAAPFFGGPQLPLPAGFAYSPASAGADTTYLGAKMASNPIGSTMGGRPRPIETTLVRPAFGTGMDDLRGGKDFYTYGRPQQSAYGGGGGRPPALISYNAATAGGRDRVVNFDGGAVLEEQMRLYQQATVPGAPLKRKDSDFLLGLRQSTWH